MEQTDSLQDREEEALDSRGLAQVLSFCQTRGCAGRPTLALRPGHPGPATHKANALEAPRVPQE